MQVSFGGRVFKRRSILFPLTAFIVGIGLTTFCAAPCNAQKRTEPCITKISIIQRDPLGNVDVGLTPDDLKWFEKTLAKHYPGICYAEQKPNEGIWFYIDVSTKDQTSATATTETSSNGIGGTVSRTVIRPKSASYPIFTLKIGQFRDGALVVLRTFQRVKELPNGSVIGMLRSVKNPERDVLLDGTDWLLSYLQPQP